MSLQDRILSKLGKKVSGGKELTEEDIIHFHHELMLEYGWIPIEEFRKMPIPALFNLVQMVTEKRKKEHEAYEKSKRKK